MIGLSFKTGTDDLRESPLVLIAEQFIGKGLNLLVYDPEVHLSRLLGANRRFIEQHLPHIGSLMRADIESVIAESDVLVVGLNDPRTLQAVSSNVRNDQIVHRPGEHAESTRGARDGDWSVLVIGSHGRGSHGRRRAP